MQTYFEDAADAIIVASVTEEGTEHRKRVDVQLANKIVDSLLHLKGGTDTGANEKAKGIESVDIDKKVFTLEQKVCVTEMSSESAALSDESLEVKGIPHLDNIYA